MTVGRAIRWTGAGQVAYIASQFIAQVVLARFLSLHDMGVYAVAAATVGILVIIQACGLQAMIVREETLNPELSATAFTLNLAIAVGLSATIAGLALAGGALLHDNDVRKVILALALTPLIGATDFLPAARLEREGKFEILAGAGIIAGLTSAMTTIAAAVFGARFMSAAYGEWASASTYALILNVVGRQYVRWRFHLAHWRRVGAFGLQMLATGGLKSAGTRLSDIVLARFQGLSLLGVFGRASTMNGLLWNNLNSAVGPVMLVDYARLNRQGLSLRERYIATVDVFTVVLWPAYAGLAIFAGPVVLLIYGARWLGAALPLAVLSLSSMVLASMPTTGEVCASTGNLRLQMRTEFWIAVMAILAFTVGSYFNLTAAAGSRIFTAAFALLLYRAVIRRLTEVSLKDLWPIYRRNGALTLLAIGPAAALMILNKGQPTTPLGYIIPAILAGVLAWVAGLWLTKHPLIAEASSFLRASRQSPALPDAPGPALSESPGE